LLTAATAHCVYPASTLPHLQLSPFCSVLFCPLRCTEPWRLPAYTHTCCCCCCCCCHRALGCLCRSDHCPRPWQPAPQHRVSVICCFNSILNLPSSSPADWFNSRAPSASPLCPPMPYSMASLPWHFRVRSMCSLLPACLDCTASSTSLAAASPLTAQPSLWPFHSLHLHSGNLSIIFMVTSLAPLSLRRPQACPSLWVYLGTSPHPCCWSHPSPSSSFPVGSHLLKGEPLMFCLLCGW
jgi:hypothetical protein